MKNFNKNGDSNILSKKTTFLIMLFIIINNTIIFVYNNKRMSERKPDLFPKVERVLSELGENIKLARLRRKLSAIQIAERANINRVTLWNIEKGSPRVAMGMYAQVLFVLGLEKDLLKVASDDTLGRKLQDAKLLVKKRDPKINKSK